MKINHKEIQLTNICPFCGEVNHVWVNEIDYAQWKNGTLAQDAFPYLSTDEREILISGVCPICWSMI